MLGEIPDAGRSKAAEKAASRPPWPRVIFEIMPDPSIPWRLAGPDAQPESSGA
jgi:hypothetical protein